MAKLQGFGSWNAYLFVSLCRQALSGVEGFAVIVDRWMHARGMMLGATMMSHFG